ncbi:hypothetical protein [Streptomyces sp. NPDC048438]|uniref:hypothetical protein n=1 Tax=Streptomyces sp. NPDC048438 TaxID=3365551 RepID=UPI00371E60C9
MLNETARPDGVIRPATASDLPAIAHLCAAHDLLQGVLHLAGDDYVHLDCLFVTEPNREGWGNALPPPATAVGTSPSRPAGPHCGCG